MYRWRSTVRVSRLVFLCLIVRVTATCDRERRKCPKNEVFVEDKVSCPPDTCNSQWVEFLCSADQKPEPGCKCADEYLRTNATGVCVPTSECRPPECENDPNAKQGCGNRCGHTCADYDKKKLCPVSKLCKLGGCDCKDGFVYDENIKKCVKIKDCTPQCTGPNEKYIDCLIGQCVPKTCNDIGHIILCPRVIPPCPGGCICDEGYLRNSKGICIKKEECPIKCGKNSHFSKCPDPCPATCSHTLPLPCKKACQPGCQCDDGYVRNINNECVLIKDCPDQAGCTMNQTWTTCNVNCPDSYCPQDDQPVPVCDAPNPCPGGCHCKINYRLNNKGKCILASECPAVNCTRPNEVWDSCPSACLAENCGDDEPVVCNTLLLNCQPRCVCAKGHFRKDGICVPVTECPKVCKDPNATWKNCPDGPDPCPATCQNTLPSPCKLPCKSGCQCNEGYVLSVPDNICVKIEDCKDHANCGVNETFVECNHRCPNVLCPKTDDILLCKPPRPCAGGCGCKPNYRHNDENQCILASECPPVECTRQNEVWTSCASEDLLEDCATRGESNQNQDTNICVPKCICKKDHYRNDQRLCVPECEC